MIKQKKIGHVDIDILSFQCLFLLQKKCVFQTELSILSPISLKNKSYAQIVWPFPLGVLAYSIVRLKLQMRNGNTSKES